MKMSPPLNEKQDMINSRKQGTNFERIRAEKFNFLKEFSTRYGYNGKIDQIREKEYPQLKNAVYLDHTGSTTYAKSAIKNFGRDLLSNLYGNPHSNSPSSRASSVRIEEVRKRILRHFNTNNEEYSVIFTANATSAAKLVGEMIPWSKHSTYKYLRESHNSINGLRRFVEKINPKNIVSLTESDVVSMIKSANRPDYIPKHREISEKSRRNPTYSLFAYPAQCNFSGMRFPLKWTREIKKLDTEREKTLVLLDAAAYVPTSPLSLADKKNSPDFVILSFYKIFGFPTGLGALIVKNELEPILQKDYFGGGTIDSVAYDRPWQKFSKDMPTRYEDGTVNFLNIIALDHAFDSFERMYTNCDNISMHVSSLITFLSRNMKSFKHWNGKRVCMVNTDRDYSDSKQHGGIFSFNVKRADGTYVGYLDIEKLASVNGIHIRSGGNCNPGSITRWCGVRSSDVIENYYEGKTCSDDKDIYKGKHYGAARLSVGAMTTIEDVLIWLDFFKRHYVEIMPGVTINDMSYDVDKNSILSDEDTIRGGQSSFLAIFKSFFNFC
nr:8511_t:CDS:1 [Entrophospora candida]CAG8620557.1 2119_t:CDS:1 [Entrophospora candida]